MKLKAFGIFCLSFFMTTAMSSCDSDEITDQPGEVSGSGNPTLTVLAEQMAGSEGYDERESPQRTSRVHRIYKACSVA